MRRSLPVYCVRGAQCGALLDAEAVLFVNDREPEIGELDIVLDQGVRSDRDAGRAVLDRRNRIPALAAAARPGKQHRHVRDVT